MITTKKSLLAITLVSALGLGVAPTLYAQNDSEEKTESELETWEVSNPPYALNEVTIKTNETLFRIFYELLSLLMTGDDMVVMMIAAKCKHYFQSSLSNSEPAGNSLVQHVVKFHAFCHYKILLGL